MLKKIFVVASLLSFLVMGTAAFAESNSATSSAANTNGKTPAMLKFDSACIQNAIDKRDTTIMVAWDTYATAIKTALQTRKEALKAAWPKPTAKERKGALKSAWDAYRKSVKEARKALNKSKKEAWKQFSTDQRACKQNLSTDAANESADNAL